jgi:hypothetical protein
MRGGAGTGPGRACAALMSDLRAGDSFDMAAASEASMLWRKNKLWSQRTALTSIKITDDVTILNTTVELSTSKVVRLSVRSGTTQDVQE